MTSLPFGVPAIPIPSVYTFPLAEMLLGVALDRVADPPETEKLKSVDSIAPEPPPVLKIGSSMVTAMVELSEASETEEITAGVPLNVQVYCVAAVLLLPEASVNTPAATFMLVKPSAAGVNVAVYTVLLVAENELIAPPTTVISLEIKFVVASLLVKVRLRV
tara:strand:- start:786 stop:1271 length:486 start_codon:yes stop_codon:yes gene_type:complete